MPDAAGAAEAAAPDAGAPGPRAVAKQRVKANPTSAAAAAEDDDGPPTWSVALAATLALLAVGAWRLWLRRRHV